MAEQWYYSSQGKDYGPVTPAQLKQLADAGQLQPADEVWKAGMTKRVPARAVKGLFAAAGQSGQATATAAPPGAQGQKSTVKSSSATPAPVQQEELVELIAAEPEPMPQPYGQPAYGQPQPYVQPQPYPQPYPQPQAGYPAPIAPGPVPVQAAGPMRAEVVEDDLQPIDEPRARPRRKMQARGGPGLGLWLGIGGGVLGLIVLVIVLILVLGGGNKITRENFAKVKNGMSESEVTGILGNPTMSVGAGGFGKVMTWQTSDLVITVTFQNGRVVQRGMMQMRGGGGGGDIDFDM